MTQEKISKHPLESTNRSRLNHEEFLGFALKKLSCYQYRCRRILGKDSTEKREHGQQAPFPSVRLMHDRHEHNNIEPIPCALTTSPGWPEFALFTTSAANVLIVLIDNSSVSTFWNGILGRAKGLVVMNGCTCMALGRLRCLDAARPT